MTIKEIVKKIELLNSELSDVCNTIHSEDKSKCSIEEVYNKYNNLRLKLVVDETLKDINEPKKERLDDRIRKIKGLDNLIKDIKGNEMITESKLMELEIQLKKFQAVLDNDNIEEFGKMIKYISDSFLELFDKIDSEENFRNQVYRVSEKLSSIVY